LETGKELSSEGGVGQLSINEPRLFSDRSPGTISVHTRPNSARPEPVGLDALRAVCFLVRSDDTDARNDVLGCFGRSHRRAQRGSPMLRSITPKRAAPN